MEKLGWMAESRSVCRNGKSTAAGVDARPGQSGGSLGFPEVPPPLVWREGGRGANPKLRNEAKCRGTKDGARFPVGKRGESMVVARVRFFVEPTGMCDCNPTSTSLFQTSVAPNHRTEWLRANVFRSPRQVRPDCCTPSARASRTDRKSRASGLSRTGPVRFSQRGLSRWGLGGSLIQKLEWFTKKTGVKPFMSFGLEFC